MIYLDNAATTKISDRVFRKVLPLVSEEYGNPSALYGLGENAHGYIDEARNNIALLIGANPENIYFTSCGSESDNWVLKSVALMYKGFKNHIITSKIEHPAILQTCQFLTEYYGCEVTYLNVDENGFIDLQELEDSIKPNTFLISIMHGNNEIGTIQQIKHISRIAHRHNILMHTDAVQTVGQIPINVDELGVDFLSISGHKLHALKGIGCLYIRNKIDFEPLINGGHQENGFRAGTENVIGIVSLGEAALECYERLTVKMEKEIKLRDYLIKQLIEIPGIIINGHPTKRLPGNINVTIVSTKLTGEQMLILLDMKGICASSGSACSSGSGTPSHVLTAIGLDEYLAQRTLRFTLNEYNTYEELDQVVDAITEFVNM